MGQIGSGHEVNSETENFEVGFFNKALRALGMRTSIPRKLRAKVLTSFAGPEVQQPGRAFEVLCNGQYYSGNTSSHVDWHVFYFGEYDPVGIGFLKAIARQINPVFIDIGANTGTHSLAIADECKTIHCFEPNPKVASELANNIERNQIENISIHRIGLSNRDDVLPFYRDKQGNNGAGTFEARNRDPDLQLNVRAGDHVFKELGLTEIDLIKIDIEGHEAKALEGLQNCLAQFRPVILWESSGALNHNSDILTRLFPQSYHHYRLSYFSRWRREVPRLYEMTEDRGRNIVSIPMEKSQLIRDLKSFGD